MHAMPERLRYVSCMGAIHINITNTITTYQVQQNSSPLKNFVIFQEL